MVTVLIAGGLRVAIYPTDHLPPHVHVYGDGEVRVELGPDAVELLSKSNVTRSEVRRALALVSATERSCSIDGSRSMFRSTLPEPKLLRTLDDLTEEEIEAAEARGAERRLKLPHATSVRHDGVDGRTWIELNNGCLFAFPPRMVQGLEDAIDTVLASVKLLSEGSALEWEALDVQIGVPALLGGVFGGQGYMERMWAARAGRATSPAKAAAARSNGAKGGRPRKTAA